MENTYTPITLHLTTPLQDDRPVYIAGSFNNWIQGDERYRMTSHGNGTYTFSFPTEFHLQYPIQYKYFKGSIDNEELTEYGNSGRNRIISQPSEMPVIDHVPHWRHNGLSCDARYLPHKNIIEEDFEIPQLGKKRRIWALLPSDYYMTSRAYPVLYLQDAQNLFNEHAPFGNWAIDEKMAILKERGEGDLIVVAIEHGGKDMLKEYSPFQTSRFGPGEGKKYAKFMVETLKPYIDKNYRTLPEREFTGLGGSSMGGLISMFAGFSFPGVFAKMMIFSPSLWVSSKIYFKAIEYKPVDPTHIYLYAGALESRYLVSNLQLLSQILKRKGFGKNQRHYHLSLKKFGTHNEKYWGEEFPMALKFLFPKSIKEGYHTTDRELKGQGI